MSTSNATFRASDVFEKISLPYSDNMGNQNAVVDHLVSLYGDAEYDSVASLVRDLEMAHWAAGSFNLIYTHEIETFISHHMSDIEDIVREYADNMGEQPQVSTFSDFLIIALDVASNDIASAIEYADLKAVVNAVDYMDTAPEVIICDSWEAEDKVSEIIQHRMDMEVQHSPTWMNSDELMALEETLGELVRVVG